ncbi:hypothetical protein GCM10027612_45960 [Microbispora bryophytorum subsp. camponoti]
MMPGKLARNRSLIDVPADLTYFVHDGKYLVVNPQVGGRYVLDAREFAILAALARPRAGGEPPPSTRPTRPIGPSPSSS